jgi:hypothetical protein
MKRWRRAVGMMACGSCRKQCGHCSAGRTRCAAFVGRASRGACAIVLSEQRRSALIVLCQMIGVGSACLTADSDTGESCCPDVVCAGSPRDEMTGACGTEKGVCSKPAKWFGQAMNKRHVALLTPPPITSRTTDGAVGAALDMSKVYGLSRIPDIRAVALRCTAGWADKFRCDACGRGNPYKAGLI